MTPAAGNCTGSAQPKVAPRATIVPEFAGGAGKLRLVLLAALAAAASASPALADGFDAERFAPAAGAAGGLAVERTEVPLHFGWGIGLFLNFADDPVVERDPDADEVLSKPVDHAFTADLLASVGLFGFAEIGLHLPVQLVYSGDTGDTAVMGPAFTASNGVGDLRAVPKVVAWRGGTASLHYALGGAVPVTLPTGDGPALRGADGVTVEPRALASVTGGRWAAHAGLGYRWREKKPAGVPVGNEITIALAGTYAWSDSLELDLEAVAGRQTSVDGPGAVETPLELLAGAVYYQGDWRLHAAAGVGLTNGLGSPDLRVLAGVRYARRLRDNGGFGDRDGDGILDKDDDCPDSAEDADGFQDEDGCPEVDNDGDGILDEEDKCPSLPEEKGGDGDGCPSKTRVVYRDGELQIFGKVQFKTGSDDIDPRSVNLLDQIAAVVREHSEIGRVRIEGHTDSVGEEDTNLRLSEGRAKSVKRALVERGVRSGRLDTKGYGESRPIAPNTTRTGRTRNRRVEFIIVE